VLIELIEMVSSNLGTLVPLAGFVGVLVAAAVTIRVSRADDEAVARWRYRVPASIEGPRKPRPSTEDALAGRMMARQLLAVAIALPFLVLIGWVMLPGSISGMYDPAWYEEALPWAGALGYLIGLGWMIRIYRANPEAGKTTWRYRP
jgi:hypothetical protein